MKYEALFKNNSRVLQLIGDAAQRTLAHAYIICARDALTLSVVSKLFYASIFCQSSNKPCLECKGCQGALNGCADILTFPAGEKVLTEDAEQISAATELKPLQFFTRIISVERAHTMTAEAQNKLLKTLEEPNPENILVFLAQNEGALLPTVRSRAKVVPITPPPTELLSRELAKQNQVDKERATLAANLCVGNLQLAEDICKNDSHIEMIDGILNMLANMQKSSQILPFAAKLAKQKEISLFLDYLETVFRDIMSVSAGVPLLLCARQEQIMKLSYEFNPAAAIRLIEYIGELREKRLLNCAQSALIDGLLMKILEVKYLCRR